MSIQCDCKLLDLKKGSTLYQCDYWEWGIGFNSIDKISYCPVCGKELPSDEESEEINE